ncbi:phage holin family protein, partial [Vibrio navarrensis]|uniref:phage holin family protein n=2 Tax=Vibrionaceae TaxID=641 RepID=UPI001F27638A
LNFSLSISNNRTLQQGVGMRMNEKVSSSLSYWWNGLIGVFGSISTDVYMVIIALVGMLLTAFINNYWQKKRFIAEYGDEQAK